MDPNQKKPSEYTVEELKREGGKIREQWADVGTTADWLRGRERNQVLVLALLLRHEHLVGKNRPRELITLLVPELCRRIEFIGKAYRELSQKERETRDALERSRAEKARTYDRIKELADRDPEVESMTVLGAVEHWRGLADMNHWAQKNPGRADHYWGLLRAVGDALGINIEDEHLAPCDLTELMGRILGSVDRPELENLFEEWNRDRDQEAQDHGTTGDRDQVPRGLVLAEDPRPAQWQTDLEQISRLLQHWESAPRPWDEGVPERVTTVIRTLDGKLNLAQEEHESIHRVLDQYMGGRALRQSGESLRDRVVRCLATMSQNIDHARAQHGEIQRKTIGLESRTKSAEAARDQAYQELSEIRNALIEVGIEFPTEPNTKAIERIADERDRARKEIEAIDRHMRPLGLSQGVSVLQRVCELVDRCEGSERSREAVEYLKLVSEYLTEYEPATGPVPLDELGDRGVVARVRKVVDKLASDLCRFKKETQTLVQELEYIKTHLKPYDIPSGPVSERVRLLTVRYQGLIKENEQLVAARALETVDTVRRRHGLEPLEKTDPGSEGIDAIRLICERAVLRYEGTFEGIEEAIGAQVRIRNEGGVFTAAAWAKALCELSGCSQLLAGHTVKVLLQGRPDVGPEGSSDAYFRLRPR